MNKIIHISTGGTIDGHVPEYPEIGLARDIFGDVSNLDNYVTRTFKVHCDYERVTVCSKDSRDITAQDLQNILSIIEAFYAKGIKKFLITHGTFTMPETGKFLLQNLDQEVVENVNIVITGSMFPLNMIGSDALLNVGAAISSLLNSSAPLGVVICMHGKNWDPRKIRKNVDTLIFEKN